MISGESLPELNTRLDAAYTAMAGEQTQTEAQASANEIIAGEAAAIKKPITSSADLLALLSIGYRASDRENKFLARAVEHLKASQAV
jgi:hypothetical protein